MMKLISAFAIAAALVAQNDRVKIDNAQVKVLVVNQNPHVKTSLHKHDVNRVMIYLQPGKQTIAYQGAQTVQNNWKAGEAKWSPASGMHIAEITSDGAVTIAEVELKTAGTKTPVKYPALDPVKIDPKHYKVEFENDQVRVVRVKIGGNEVAPMHEHGLNRVVVYLSDMNFRVTSADGKVDMVNHKAGEVSWGVPNKHKEENLSAKPVEIVVVEVKS